MFQLSLLFLISHQTLISVAGSSSPSCDEVEERVAEADKNTVILYPPALQGKWLSEKCETRPGPEYLLRSHMYTDNETYTALVHRYRDETCSTPWVSTLTRGRAALRGRSWLAPAAAQADFNIDSVAILAHNQKAADEVTSALNISCAGIIKRRLRPHTEYTIFTSREAADLYDKEGTEWLTGSLDCVGPLGLPHEDAGLLRVQVRPPGPPDSSGRRTELLLGAPKPKGSSFHTPLLSASESGDCEICSAVNRSTLHSPPRLAPPAPGPLFMAGEWVSTRCEARPMGLFLRRRLRVSGRSWQADFRFFSDPICSAPTLTASAEGTLAPVAQQVPRIPGAADYDFRVLRAFLTLHDDGLVSSLSRDTACGPSGSWQLGMRRDVTPSHGCPALGITVPTTEYELVRLELDPAGHALLYLGQSEQRKDGKKQRPTAFQPPLLQCNAPELPPLTHFLNSYNGAHRNHIVFPLSLFVLLVL